jgi:hypothetical protein
MGPCLFLPKHLFCISHCKPLGPRQCIMQALKYGNLGWELWWVFDNPYAFEWTIGDVIDIIHEKPCYNPQYDDIYMIPSVIHHV